MTQALYTALDALDAALATGDEAAVEAASDAIQAALPAVAADLAEYLDGNLRDGLDPREFADQLLFDHDWSRGTTLEVRGFYTATGNPLLVTL